MMRPSVRAAAVTLIGLTALWSCHSTEGDVKLPQKATDFIYKYFPASYVSSREEPSEGVFVVRMTNGPTLTFDDEGSWTDLQGNGGTLPQMIAFDYFPAQLYDYIEEKEEIDAIYAVSRDERYYNVLLFDTRLDYDLQTEKVTEIAP